MTAKRKTERPGAWMRYGRAPLALIPEEDTGPIVGSAVPHIHGYGDQTGENFRRWHRLRKAGLA